MKYIILAIIALFSPLSFGSDLSTQVNSCKLAAVAAAEVAYLKNSETEGAIQGHNWHSYLGEDVTWDELSNIAFYTVQIVGENDELDSWAVNYKVELQLSTCSILSVDEGQFE